MTWPPNDLSGPSALAQVNTARELPRNSSPTLGVSQEGRVGSYHVHFPSNTTTHTELQVFFPNLPSIYLCHCIREYQAGWSRDNSFVYWVTKNGFAHPFSREMLIKCKKSTFCISQDMSCCLFN